VNSRRFHITVRSALAGFLLMGGLQALILSLREPLSSGAIAVANWFIGKIRPDAFKLRGTAIDWTFFEAEMIIGLILVMLAIGFGASALRSSKSGVRSQ